MKTITYAVYDLCLYLKYIVPFRCKIEGLNYIKLSKIAKDFLLLDKFIKQSARLTLVQASKSPITLNWAFNKAESLQVMTKHMVFKPFVLSDGTQHERKNYAYISLWAMLHDS